MGCVLVTAGWSPLTPVLEIPPADEGWAGDPTMAVLESEIGLP